MLRMAGFVVEEYRTLPQIQARMGSEAKQ